MAQDKIEMLKNLGVKPQKRFGQNFMIEEWPINKMLETGEAGEQDTIVEVGPGSGFLTQALGLKAKKIIAIEKDRGLVPMLRRQLSGLKNVEIIEADALRFNYDGIKGKYKVISNLPFYITSPLIRLLLETKNQPSLIVLLIQNEVADRLAAHEPKMNLLAACAQFYAKIQKIVEVPKECFSPRPKVNAAIVKIIPIKQELSQANRDLFFRIIKAGFSHPRKIALNNLRAGLKLDKTQAGKWFESCGIDLKARPQNIGLKNWILLIKNFYLHFPLC